MKFKRLILRNFLTYEFLDYKFVEKPLQIQGENLTDDNQKTNGSGKTGLLTAIEYAVTAMNSRGIRDVELITFEENQAQIELFAHCPVREELLHIHWFINRKGANKLELKIKKKDQWETQSFSDLSEGKEMISNWFLISRDDLFNYYFINKRRFKSFFKSSNEEKIGLINRFSDASIIDGLDKSLDADISEIETEIQEFLETIISNQATEREKESSLEYENSRDLAEERKDLIKGLDEIIMEKKEEVEEEAELMNELAKEAEIISKEITAAKKLFKEAELALQNLKLENYSEKLNEVLKTEKNARKRLLIEEKSAKQRNDSAKKASKIIAILNNQLAGIITCPKCNHKFSLIDEDLEYEEVVEKKTKAEKIKTLLDDAIVEIEISKQSIEKEIDKVAESKQDISKKESAQDKQVRELRKNVNDLDVSLEKLIRKNNSNIADVEESKSRTNLAKENIKKLEQEKKQIKKPNNEKRIQELLQEKEDLKKETLKLEKTIKEKEAKKSKLVEWKNEFKRFRMFIANQSLGTMEYYCNDYLLQMGSDMRVKFSGFKVNADGKIREEITALIERERERTFDSFSGGEQGRLLFASILANKFLIDSSHPYGGLDFIGIDEIFEGVDSLGLKYIMESVKDMESTIMLITHVSDEELDSNTIKVIKINNKSTIEYE